MEGKIGKTHWIGVGTLLIISSSLLIFLFGQIQGVPSGQSVPDPNETITLANPIEVTFLGNCGFIIQVKKKKILIDIGSPEKSSEKSILNEMYDMLAANKPPMQDIGAIFISHSHDDHIGVKELLKCMKKNKNLEIYVNFDTWEVMRKTNNSMFRKIEDRVFIIDPFDTGTIEKTLSGLKVEFLGMYHAGAPEYIFKDLSFVFEISDVRIFYLSDVDPGYERNYKILEKWSAKNKKVDLLLAPDVNLYPSLLSANGFEIIPKFIRPKRVIAMHIDPKKFDEAEKKVKVNFPDVTIFKTLLEKTIFN